MRYVLSLRSGHYFLVLLLLGKVGTLILKIFEKREEFERLGKCPKYSQFLILEALRERNRLKGCRHAGTQALPVGKIIQIKER